MEHRDPEITRVAVLMGGWDNEREVSLSSGRACAKALDEAGFQVSMIDVQPNIIEQLRAGAARRRLQCVARQVGRGRACPGHS